MIGAVSMGMRYLCCVLIVLSICVLGSGISASELPGVQTQACGDSAEWSPYLYFVREEGEKTGTVDGFSVAVVRGVVEEEGADVNIRMASLPLCLCDVRGGERA